MPGVALHMVLADRALACWREGSATAPFDVNDPTALNAWRHGAVAPDLGYFPGGDRVLSDLAHCVRTGVLARTLLQTAGSEVERAFALGWLTHFLGDAQIHPLIGRAVGELLTGSRETFVDGSSDLLAHLRVEMGLDTWYAHGYPEVFGRRLAPALGEPSTRWLARAYALTYDVHLPDEMFARSLRISSRRVGQALLGLRLLGGLIAPAPRPVLQVLRVALGAAYRAQRLRSTTLAFLNPVEPTGWLLREVTAATRAHTVGFLRHVGEGGAHLEDVNLDTGRPLAAEREHVGTRRALDALDRLAA